MDRRLFLSLMTAGALCPTKDKYGCDDRRTKVPIDIAEHNRIDALIRKKLRVIELRRKLNIWEGRHWIMSPEEVEHVERTQGGFLIEARAAGLNVDAAVRGLRRGPDPNDR